LDPPPFRPNRTGPRNQSFASADFCSHFWGRKAFALNFVKSEELFGLLILDSLKVKSKACCLNKIIAE
jgi:hypothetical protein